MKNIKKTLATAVFALSSIAATAIIPATSVIGISVATTGLMTISTPAQAAQQCANLVFKSQGIKAYGITYKAKKRRAERRVKRQWRRDVAGHSTLGSRYADLDNAKNIVINCLLKDKGGSMSCTLIAQPCTDD